MAFDDMAWGIDEITENVKTGIIPIVKSVQMGTYTFTNQNNATITITSANPAKYIVLIDSELTSYGYYHSSADNGSYFAKTSRLISKSSNSFVISPNYGYHSWQNYDGGQSDYIYGTVTWQLIEFY